MKWLPIASLLLLVFVAPSPAEAQAPREKSSVIISPGELTPTPEMWFYEQDYQRYMDPKMMARQKAEFRSAERQRRLETRRWYGMSNMRPHSGTDPVHGETAPHWASGSYYQPNRWSGSGAAAVVVRPSTSTVK